MQSDVDSIVSGNGELVIADPELEQDDSGPDKDSREKSPSPDSIEDLPMEALIGLS